MLSEKHFDKDGNYYYSLRNHNSMATEREKSIKIVVVGDGAVGNYHSTL